MKTGSPYHLSWRFFRVWQRNLTVYRQIWIVSFMPPLLEPIFYLLAFGYGLGSLVGKVNYQGLEVSYPAFIAPALMAISIMYNSFFENTYGSFVRMHFQKTFDAMLATPLSLEDIITGEIVWGATTATIACMIMTTVISCFGWVCYPHGLLLIPIALVGGFAMGSMGMIFTGLIPHIQMFNLPVFLFITPMFLFSGTFFPLSTLPAWGQNLAALLPLTHLANLTRAVSAGQLRADLLGDLLYLVLFAGICYPLALFLMRRRLIH